MHPDWYNLLTLMATHKSKEVSLLGDILVSHGVLTMAQLHEALCKQHNSDKPIGQVTQDLGMATISQVNAALADQQWRRRNREDSPAK